VLSEPTTDLYCGFKLWRGPVAEDVFARIHLDGWTFDAEALGMARALGYRLRETGIVWTDREGSRLSMARVLVPVVRELIAARRHIRREARRPCAALTEAPAAEPQG
jgi:dolichyl-phosphate beta-glucosyltransferase